MLCLLVLLVAAAGWYGYMYLREVPDVERVEWGMSRSEVGLILDKVKRLSLETSSETVLIYRTTLAKVPVALGCFFEENELHLLRYSPMKKEYATGEAHADFLAVKTYLVKHFGEPSGDTDENGQQVVFWTIPGREITLVFDNARKLWALDIESPAEQPGA